MTKYLITGGLGFIGSNFVELLLKQNKDRVSLVRVLDKVTYAANPHLIKTFSRDSRFEFFKADICSRVDSTSAVEGIDTVVNFAAESHVDRSIQNSTDFVNTNILGVQNLLEISLQFGISRFIQISTDEVYGSLRQGSATEDYRLEPNSPYAASKAAADLLVRSFFVTHGLPVLITRSCNNYGLHQYPEKLIPLAISNLAQQRSVPLYGDGRNIREWLHVEDNCSAILKLAEEGKNGEVYNLGSGDDLENLDLVAAICNRMDMSSDLIHFSTDRKGHDFRYSLNSEKFISEFGSISNHRLLDEIPNLIDFYSRNFQT
jgi:dTDP-glucose 4,6-dehydratase